MSAVGLPLAVGRARLPAAVRRFLEQECFVVLVLASTLAFVAYAVPTLLVQDTWLALVDGRFVATKTVFAGTWTTRCAITTPLAIVTVKPNSVVVSTVMNDEDAACNRRLYEFRASADSPACRESRDQSSRRWSSASVVPENRSAGRPIARSPNERRCRRPRSLCPSRALADFQPYLANSTCNVALASHYQEC